MQAWIPWLNWKLIGASINSQQDDISSFPVLPKTLPSPAKGKKTTISLACPFQPFADSHSELPTFVTRGRDVWRQRTQTPSAGHCCRERDDLPLQVSAGEGGVRESQGLCSSSSLTADLVSSSRLHVNMPEGIPLLFSLSQIKQDCYMALLGRLKLFWMSNI